MVLGASTGFQDFAQEQSVVALVELAHQFALPPSRGAGQQGASSFGASHEVLPADGIALAFEAFEEGEGQIQLILADHVHRKNASLRYVSVGPGITLNANSHQGR